MYNGKFIVIEGLDGSGKSTQVELLKDYLESLGKEVVVSKEPTKDSSAGIKIREIIEQREKASAEKLQELMAEDREQHLKNKIIPALEKGKYVISDRYYHSSFAYGIANGVDVEYLKKINKDFLKPDIVIYVDTPSDVCLERIAKRGQEFTYFEKKMWLEKVEGNYKELDDLVSVNGEQTIEEISNDIQKIIKTLWQKS